MSTETVLSLVQLEETLPLVTGAETMRFRTISLSRVASMLISSSGQHYN